MSRHSHREYFGEGSTGSGGRKSEGPSYSSERVTVTVPVNRKADRTMSVEVPASRDIEEEEEE